MEFVIVPKGKSWLGGGKDKLGDKEVEIPADFYLGKYEVTQEEWEKVMGENPSHFSRNGGGKDAVKDIPDADLKRFPVENVSWDQCQVFVAKLNKREKETGWVYRLPKEAEWEYACRGGPMADKAGQRLRLLLRQADEHVVAGTGEFRTQRTRIGRARWAPTSRIVWVYTICTATCGSGATTPRKRPMEPRVRSAGAAAGRTTPGTAGRRSATTRAAIAPGQHLRLASGPSSVRRSFARSEDAAARRRPVHRRRRPAHRRPAGRRSRSRKCGRS